MKAVDEAVLIQVRDWLQAGQSCWLATVVGTWGSSPRPVGSLLACNDKGQIVGSLSGGCVEDDLLEKLVSGELAREQPQYFEYGVSAEDTERFGLPCGGQLYIVVEPLQPEPRFQSHFQAITEHLRQRECIQRTLNLTSGAFELTEVDCHSELEYDREKQILRQTYGPRFQLFIIGAGMVSRYLAEMAQSLDYLVTVCDPREHLLADFDVPGVQKICDMPDDAIRAQASDAMSAIVALTHDPRIDDMGLMQALETAAFYVGAMGSKRTTENRLIRLKQLDLSDSALARLHAPIGLPIGSKTPPEIAIAILAEIIAVRHGKRSAQIAPAAPEAARA